MLTPQIQTNLLVANSLSENFLQQLTARLMARGANFSDIYLQNTTSESWSLDEGIIKSGSFAINSGVGIRAICESKTFLNYSNIITKTSITRLIDDLFIEPANNQTPQTKNVLDKNIGHLIYTQANPITALSSTQKTALLKFINEEARKKAWVSNVISTISFEYDEICVIRSDDRIAGDIRPLIHINISIIVTINNVIERGYSGFGGRYSLSEVSLELITKHIEIAYNQAILKSEAVAAPSGKLPVVLGNGWAGVILHEAIGHGLESDFNRKGSSAFSNKIGTRVANEQVTIIDEGCISNRRGSLNIDDEGNPTQKTVLIENGILKNYMFDELNAGLMGTVSTGNGRRESFAAKPIPRMTNTYMLNGSFTHDEIIESIDDGIYAESFEGGQVDITSGQFVFNASVAWVIKKGKLAYPIKGCALVGSGPECLKFVSMVANNMELDQGVGICGKDGQSVPVGVGQPTIRIDDGLVIGGS